MSGGIYIDTNVFVLAFETEGTLSEWAWTILDAVTQGNCHAFTSELTLAELLPKPLRLGSALLTEIYRGLIVTGGSLSVASVYRSILIRSAEIRSAHRSIRLPDAIHVATALEAGCAAFVSNDRRLRPPASLPRIPLGPDSLVRIHELHR